MRKLLLAVCGVLLGCSLCIRADVSAEHAENYEAIKTEMQVLLVSVVEDVEKRNVLASAVEFKIAKAIGRLEKLYLEGDISADEMKAYNEQYVDLWRKLSIWKEAQ